MQIFCGSWGCRLSHLCILRDALAKGYRRIAIFEDDVVLTENFDQAFLDFKDELIRLPDSFAMAYLSLNESAFNKPSEPMPGYDKIQSIKIRAYGTCAYIVNNQHGTLFETLIEKIVNRSIEIDLLYANLISAGMLQNRCFLAVPQLARPDTLPSSIQCPHESFTLDQFVNMTYFINSDEDVARRQQMEKQFADLGISNYRRITKKVTSWDDIPLSHNLLLDVPDFVATLSETEKKSYVLDLWASRTAHLACVQDAQANDFHTIAVFDDECSLAPDFGDRFNRFAKDLNGMDDHFEVGYLNSPVSIITGTVSDLNPLSNAL